MSADPPAGAQRDRWGLLTSVAIGGVAAVVAMVVSLAFVPVVHHGHEWFIGGDIWPLVVGARKVSLGDLPYVYQTPASVYALPLGFIYLAPAVALGDHLNLVDGYPFAVARPSMWLVVGPWSFLPIIAVVDAGRRLARQIGISGKLLVGVQVAVAVAVMVPDVCWDHPEDVIALAALLHAVRCSRQGQPRASALALGLAVASKQWALVAVPVLLLEVPAERRLGWLLRAGALPAALAAICLTVDWPDASSHLFTPRTPVTSLGEPSLLGHVFGGATSMLMRALEVGLGVPAAWMCRRCPGLDRVAVLGALLLVRPLLEPASFSYYWMPGLLLLTIAVARRRAPLTAWSVVALCLIAWLTPAHFPRPLAFWCGMLVISAGFAVLAGTQLASAAPGRRQISAQGLSLGTENMIAS